MSLTNLKTAPANTSHTCNAYIPPFKLNPAFKDYIWGGTKLKTEYGKHTDLSIIAESWELSAHPSGSSVIADGAFAGMPFNQFVSENPWICGTRCTRSDFPILVKLIDAKDSLSIQVHPDNAYAYRVEGESGKTEMWVVLDRQKDAFLYFGFKSNITKDEYATRMREGKLTSVLNKVPVNPGDVFFIPAGTIHAIGKGITLAEIQQSSNSTYRIDDFGRMGVDGKPRPLHIDKALEVTALTPASYKAPGQRVISHTDRFQLERLAQCPEFTVDRLTLNGTHLRLMRRESFLSVLCVDGGIDLITESNQINLVKGSSVFLSAGDYPVAFSGHGSALLSGI